MQATKSLTSSIALRVATAMQQHGIESLPRNYELVYEAYSGGNPELAREFIALGPVKSQEALDRLGQRYLPHHHDRTLFERQSNTIRAEMSSFIGLLNLEKTSLTQYGQAIGELSRTIGTENDLDQDLIHHSIMMLRSATAQQAAANGAMVRSVVDQTALLADMQREFDDEDAARFTDPLTGLGNRRALNTLLAGLYANPALPTLCWLAVGDINDFSRVSEQMGVPAATRFLRHVAKSVSAVLSPEDTVCRLDGGRFAFVFGTADETEAMRMADMMRSRLRLGDVNSARPGSVVPMSLGLCSTAQANNSFDLVTFAEKALAISRQTEGNPAIVYGVDDPRQMSRGWMIYRK